MEPVGDGLLLVADGRLYAVWGVGLAICLAAFAALGALLAAAILTTRRIDAYTARCQAAAERLATDTAALARLEAVQSHTSAILLTARAIERQDIEIGRRLHGEA